MNKQAEHVKQLLRTGDEANAEIALHLLVHLSEDAIDKDLATLLMQGVGYVERCVQLRARHLYPHFDSVSIWRAPDAEPLDEDFWREFALLTNLQSLRLVQKTSISPVWAQSVGSLPNLRVLSLEQCGLTELPEELAQLAPVLTKLHLNKEPIEQLPAWLAQFEHLRTLSLCSCPLRRLPEWLVKIQSLIRLALPDNLLTEIPMSIGFLPELIELNLSDNQIRRLPTTLRQLSQLRRLFLGGNPISAEEKRQLYSALPQTLIF